MGAGGTSGTLGPEGRVPRWGFPRRRPAFTTLGSRRGGGLSEVGVERGQFLRVLVYLVVGDPAPFRGGPDHVPVVVDGRTAGPVAAIGAAQDEGHPPGRPDCHHVFRP